MGVTIPCKFGKIVLGAVEEFESEMRRREIPEGEWDRYWLEFLQTL